MLDQLAQVPRKNALGVESSAVRLRALAVRAKIRHDHPKASARDPLGVAELDPVHLRVGEEAVEQDHRGPLPQFMPGEFNPVRSVPQMSGSAAQAGIFPVASTHLSTSA